MRYALLLCAEQAAELLPHDASAHEAGLSQGPHYSCSLAGGASLHWKQSPLLWQANPLASALAGAQVCGDAVLSLPGPFGSDEEAASLLDALLSKSPRRRSQQPAAQPGRAAGGGAAGRVAEAAGGTSAPASSPAVSSGASAAPAAATAQPLPVPGRGLSGSGSEDFEPRQQLLWAIASRATSISWAPSTPPSPPSCLAAAQALSAASGAGAESSSASADQSVEQSDGAGAGTEATTSSCSEPEEAPSCGAPCSSGSSSDDGHSRGWAPWAYARPEILALVVAQAGHHASFAQRLSHVCSGWRQAMREERGMLRLLRFDQLALRTEPVAGAVAAAAARGVWAARAGSVSAAVVAAWHLEILSPLPSEVAWLWGKAARRGHPEAQAKLGLAYYRGALGLACDCQEAMLWLSRAAKQLAEHLEPAPAGASGVPPPGAAAIVAAQAGGAVAGEALNSSGGSGAAEGRGRPRGAPLLMSHAASRRCFAQVAHILGLLALDGEGTKKDLRCGVQWLKVAEQHGCKEAGLILGSLYNTGQYG